MRLGIIGGGWAGLSAAVRAADLGHDVTVFEASHTLGGRARTVHSSRLQARIDNGQHIMLGAYRETLALMERLGIDTSKALQRERLSLESADGGFRLQVPQLPAPLHLPIALFRARGINLQEKLGLARALKRLRDHDWLVTPGTTVHQWLDQHRQSPRVQALFWQPLCIAALNTSVKDACAQLFATVLRDSLGGTRDACDILLPTLDLSALWPDQTEHLSFSGNQGSLSIRRGTVVTRLELAGSGQSVTEAIPSGSAPLHGGVLLNEEHFDAVVIACNVPSAQRLLNQLPVIRDNAAEVQRLMGALSRFTYIPIATVTLKLAHHWTLPRSMYLLREDRTIGHYGQWLFYNPAFIQAQGSVEDDPLTASTSDIAPVLAQVVISDAQTALAGGDAALVSSVVAQLKTQTARFGTMPAVTAHTTIAEKRATFAATPGLIRPSVTTPWPGVWLAGDWTDTGYPAVLEGAVRSGHKAACALI